MRRPVLAGNWKMNKKIEEAVKLATELKAKLGEVKDRDIIICPPYTSLGKVRDVIKDSNIKMGAQDLFWEEKGAFTGEVSGPMLKDAGCDYVIIGHSERRQYFGETDESVNKKMKAAFNFGIIPIVCVGETLKQREENITFKVVEKQIHEGIKGLDENSVPKLIVAYEPVWAIGTGKTATPEQAEEVHKFIRQTLKRIYGDGDAHSIRILYGGSVTPANIAGLMNQEDIDGGLVGGASLDTESFIKLVNY
ncbi:MAG: triose-phosphate isomerase [bacterium]